VGVQDNDTGNDLNDPTIAIKVEALNGNALLIDGVI
jgi:hypothetical protein